MPTTTDSDIVRHRTSKATLTVTQPNGAPLAGKPVTIAQVNHQFLFGCTGSNLIAFANNELTGEALAKAQLHAERWEGLFNFVTLPFYWGGFEKVQGKPDTKRLQNAAKWFTDRGIPVKGHPLVWHSVCADWLLPMSVEQIIETQLARIRRDVKDFAGLIEMWDVINEVVIMPIFDKYDNGITRMCKKLGRIDMIRQVFKAARETNPSAMLLLNDFDMSAAYECLIEGVLEGGIKIDALGLQSHMHQGYWGVEKTLNVLERFGKYNIPIHFTETTLVSGEIMPAHIVDLNDHKVDEWPTTPEGEARQAEETVTHYKALLADPRVKALTWWGLPDGGWLKAPSGLIRTDLSPKPAYLELQKLIKGQWWTKPTTLTTDSKGNVSFTGFLGDYELSFGNSKLKFTLDKSGETKTNLTI